MKPLTKTHSSKKTEEDYRKISDIEWLQGAYISGEDESRKWEDYLTDDMKLYIPSENIEATMKNAGKQYKLGKDIVKYVSVCDIEIPLDIGEGYSIKKLWKDNRYRHVCQMVVSQARVTRTRPRFSRWQIAFDLLYDEEKIDLAQIITVMEYAGQYVGLCDSRPRYGKFVASISEVVEAVDEDESNELGGEQ